MNPQTESPLVSLPPELRNRIYTEVFADTIIEIKGKSGQRSYVKSLGILLACKQTNEEATGIYYHSVHFEMRVSARNISVSLTRWLKKLPDRRVAVMTDIKLMVHDTVPYSATHGMNLPQRRAMATTMFKILRSKRGSASKLDLLPDGSLKLRFVTGWRPNLSVAWWTSKPLAEIADTIDL
jgi:hypothetical protein